MSITTGLSQKKKTEKLSYRLADITAFVIYALLGCLSIFPAITGGITHTLQLGGYGDPTEQAWLLAQTPWSIIHGVNPFSNNWINYPTGANLLANTSMPLLGILLAPVTLLSNSIAALNIGFILSVATSGFATYILSKHIIKNIFGSFFAGLLYACSPYMVAEENGHLNLIFLAFFPLMVLTLYKIVEKQFKGTLLLSMTFGFLFACEFYVSAELLSDFTVLLVIAFIYIIATNLKQTLSCFKYLALNALTALSIILFFVLPGAFYAMKGPNSYSGSPQPTNQLHELSLSLASLIIPTSNQKFSFGLQKTGTGLMYIILNTGKHIASLSENGGYIGIPLLLFLIIATVIYFNKQHVKLLAFMTVVSYLIAMGSRFKFYSAFSHIPLLYALISHIPYLSYQVPARYTSLTWLFLALLFSILLTNTINSLVRISKSKQFFRNFSAVSITTFLVITIISLCPTWPYSNEANVNIPTFFSTTAKTLIPTGSSVLTYPLPYGLNDTPMAWQLQDSMRFKLVNGYIIKKGKDGKASFDSAISSTQSVFEQCYLGYGVKQLMLPYMGPVSLEYPHLSNAKIINLVASKIRSEATAWKVDFVIASGTFSGFTTCAFPLLKEAFGHSWAKYGPIYVWKIGRT